MEVLKERYTITELSQLLNVTTHALRFYEKEFNLSIPKDNRGRRFYPTEFANVMYQIKNMRDEGLEIKAIKKILDSEGIVGEPPPVVLDNDTTSIMPVQNNHKNTDISQYFNDFRDQITGSITAEAAATKEVITREISRTKLELGACVENSVRKLEFKMDRHFQDVDKMLGQWREKNKGSAVKRFFNKVIK
ncbi:MAG: MerR family transcriptional regulator [Bacillota bacterium]|nr:MerR family transcriptional regulator [Bacillota bacterium]